MYCSLMVLAFRSFLMVAIASLSGFHLRLHSQASPITLRICAGRSGFPHQRNNSPHHMTIFPDIIANVYMLSGIYLCVYVCVRVSVSSIVREIWHVIVVFVKKAGCHWSVLRTPLSLNFSGRHQELKVKKREVCVCAHSYTIAWLEKVYKVQY